MSQYLARFDRYIKSANLQTRPHQREAVQWCLKNEMCETAECRGGLIADEMGLGKTIVMMGLLVTNFVPKTLIVLPLALVEQWRREIGRTMSHNPLVFHGDEKKQITFDQLKRAPIVLTTYGHIADTAKNVDLHKIKWNRVIFDEAHHLRNSNTQIHRGACKLESVHRWLITGTPIQNSKDDFYALCSAMGLSSSFYTNPDNIITIMKNFIMRRTKQDVGINLPKLHDEKIVVEWETDEERELAKDIHSRLSFSGVSSSQCDNMMSGMDENVLSLLVKARQTCVYPGLLAKHVDKFVKKDMSNETQFLKSTKNSSKINAVVKKIVERKDFGKKLIFCHYRGEIDEIQSQLEENSFSVLTYDGRTTNAQREEIFTNNADILILQIQTGCEGLNLQNYNEVYFVSPHWNPAIEDQAVARCHRIGQTKEVFVWRFIMESFDSDERTQSLDNYSSAVQDNKREDMRLIEKDADEDEIKRKFTIKIKKQKKKAHEDDQITLSDDESSMCSVSSVVNDN